MFKIFNVLKCGGQFKVFFIFVKWSYYFFLKCKYVEYYQKKIKLDYLQFSVELFLEMMNVFMGISFVLIFRQVVLQIYK